ncbi:hypothetical protein [Paenibacillus gallinarum]|uniref:Uncharacterized protein n=1 Tax=Paenibacillus gallinarum TaxID=2762232 RepID=A0ABR8SWK5_9BACL|nr:hypothetical protein [Paenibacillus gallinarum]MBD7967714.1 hypothetical protein [Paenibacillus gallinarum]
MSNELSQEKLDWMNEVGMKEFEEPMKYCLGANYVYSERYIKNTPLAVLKENYEKSKPVDTEENDSAVVQIKRLLEQFDKAVNEVVQSVIAKSETYKEAQDLLREGYYSERGKLESLVWTEAKNRLTKGAELQVIKK